MTIKEEWYAEIKQAKENVEEATNAAVTNLFENIKSLNKGNSVSELQSAILKEIKDQENMPAVVADRLKRRCDDYISNLEIK